MLPRDDGGIQESFHRVVKDRIRFTLQRDESIEKGRVCEHCDGGSDDELP